MPNWPPMRRHRAYQLIEAVGAVSNVSTTVDIAPANEAQARPLTRLEPEQQREAWGRALEMSPAPTAAVVERAVREVEGRPHVANNSGNNEWYTPAEWWR